jgi:hypothetical protein
MLVGRTRATFLTATLSAVSIGALIACSATSSNSSSSASSTAQPPCPASYADVASASCSVEGQVCPFLAPCATFATNASCVCSGGRFACSGFGDAGVACPVLSTTEACPVSERVASGLFCSDLGLICTYASACTSIPAYDTCQCVGGRTATEGNHFQCVASCMPTGDAIAPGPVPEAGTADATSGDDAPADGPPADAAPSSTDGANDR